MSDIVYSFGVMLLNSLALIPSGNMPIICDSDVLPSSYIFVLSFDFVLSNTVLKYNHCYKFEEYFYELKKNCKGKYRFKKSFPVKLTITDEMGLRIGKKK